MDYSGGHWQATPEPVSVIAAITPFLALIAAIFSLVGFLSATVLAWRKEKRDVLVHEIDLEKKELEIAKLRFELDRLTLGNKNEAASSGPDSNAVGNTVPEARRGDEISESDTAWRPTQAAQADG
jgi:hypothetical protein